jgi:hypothetical protein
MYATGVGLVIEGIGRYQKEVEKMRPEEPVFQPDIAEPVSRKKKEKEKKVKDPSRPTKGFSKAFLDKIRNIFEEDDA